MNSETKTKLAGAVDALVRDGYVPSELHVHPTTADELGITSTHLDLSTHQSADEIAAELMHIDYDRNPGRDDKARPKTADEATRIAKSRCEAKLRRDVVLLVVIDTSIIIGKLVVTGPKVSQGMREV